MPAHPIKLSHKPGHVKKGIRGAFKGSDRPRKNKPKPIRPPKDKGRGKRKVKITFNSPKLTKVSYG